LHLSAIYKSIANVPVFKDVARLQFARRYWRLSWPKAR